MSDIKWTNQEKIEQFGMIHYNMRKDAPSDCLDNRLIWLNNYIDKQTIKRWVLPRLPMTRRDKISILDVGAGKGRMMQYFLGWAKNVVAIEPFGHFYEILKETYRSTEVYQGTLDEYAGTTNNKFDLIFISGVTMYINEAEMPHFMESTKKILQPWGLVFIRDLGLTRGKVSKIGEREILRSSGEMLSIFRHSGFRCVKFRRAYPVNIPLKLWRKWPNVITEMLWDISSSAWAYPLWDCLAQLDIPHLGSEVFFYYLLERYSSNTCQNHTKCAQKPSGGQSN